MGRLLVCLFLLFFVRKISFLVFALLLLARRITFYLLLQQSTWIGAVFFLIYVGAILVILFYIFSLSSKLKFFFNTKTQIPMVFFFLFPLFFFDFMLEERKIYSHVKEHLVSFFDGFFLFFSLILFIRLWISAKLHVYNNLALRICF